MLCLVTDNSEQGKGYIVAQLQRLESDGSKYGIVKNACENTELDVCMLNRIEYLVEQVNGDPCTVCVEDNHSTIERGEKEVLSNWMHSLKTLECGLNEMYVNPKVLLLI
jgi:hypothetical protein